MIDDSRKIKREIKNWKKKKRRIGLIIIDPFLNRCIYIYISKNYLETRLIHRYFFEHFRTKKCYLSMRAFETLNELIENNGAI